MLEYGTGRDLSHLPAICVNEVSPGVFSQRVIVASAIRVTLKDGTKLPIMSSRHGSPGLHRILDVLKSTGALGKDWGYGEDQGFTDQWDTYWNRVDALTIATHAGQLEGREKTGGNDCLYSEDVWG